MLQNDWQLIQHLLIGCDSKKKLELQIDIKETDNFKILGVIFYKKLSFQYLTEKLSKSLEKS